MSDGCIPEKSMYAGHRNCAAVMVMHFLPGLAQRQSGVGASVTGFVHRLVMTARPASLPAAPSAQVTPVPITCLPTALIFC